MLRTTLATVLILLTVRADAQESVGRGVGSATCAEAIQIMKGAPDELSFMSWAQGFMTGWNVGARLTGQQQANLSAVNHSAQQAFIINYCDRNQLHLYMQAVIDLYISLPKIPAKIPN